MDTEWLYTSLGDLFLRAAPEINAPYKWSRFNQLFRRPTTILFGRATEYLCLQSHLVKRI
jgi:hypothetical protein